MNYKYKINKFGARSSNFTGKKKTIGFFGCSITYGHGLNEQSTFANRTCEKINDYEYLKEGFLSSDLIKNENDIQCNFFSIENNSELLSKKGTFSRIIASHVLEHLEKPEEAIIEWVELLSDDGIISISIPADPGLFWKIGQLISFNKFLFTKFNLNMIMFLWYYW